jgi:hypothetical protein
VDFHFIASVATKLNCCYNIQMDQLQGKQWDFATIVDNTKHTHEFQN